MQTIYLDISNKGTVPCINAKQGEVGRKFVAVISDNGVPYNISRDSLLSVWYEGETDAGNYSSIEEKSAFIIDGNKVTVELVAQMLLKPGNGEMCLSVSHSDGDETNTWNIPYCVEYKPGAGSSVPTEYYTALTEAASSAAQYVTQAFKFAEDAKKSAEDAADAAESVDSSIESAVADLLPKDGGTMSGTLNMGGNPVANVKAAQNDSDAVNYGQVAALLLQNIEKAHPVGYTFTWDPVDGNETDLSTAEKVYQHFGFGTWEQVKDVFILAAGETYDAGSVGGEETHTLTIEEMPAHSHELLAKAERTAGTPWSGTIGTANATEPIARLVGETGGGSPFRIMPPYRAMYVWKRIA